MGGEGYEIVAAHRHDRKLRRGALQGNRFDVLLTDCTAAPDVELTSSTVEQHLQVLRLRGVPNYFGPQRFGRDAGNLLRARTWAESGDDPRADRSQRSFALSAARSLIFNTVLARRVRAETWDRLLPGDIANFDDGATVFAVAAVDEALQARASRGEIHPTGPLWGRGGSLAAGAAVDELEAQAAEECAPLPQWLLAEGLESQRRPLRLMPRDLQAQWQAQERQLRIGFTLGAGAFATTVLAELFAFDGPVAEA
jgi:tRNA pseudouridine13 synthase